MSVSLYESAHIVVDRIKSLADHDRQFRLALESILEGLSRNRAEECQPQVEDIVSTVDAEDGRPGEEDGSSIAMDEPLPPAVPVQGAGQARQPIEIDLSVIEARCRLKAQGARWAAERQQKLHAGAPFSIAIAPYDQDLIERAKGLGCLLWMNGRKSPHPADLGLFDVLGSGFEVAADAAALLRDCVPEVEDEELFKQCLDVAAEAQSALRSAVMAVEAPADADQRSLYECVRIAAAEAGIYVERHLRADDPADPYSLSDIHGRLRAVRDSCQTTIDRRRQRNISLNRLRYHAKLICKNGGRAHDWNIVAQVADEMVRGGVPPSNRDIRDAILPIIDAVPMSNGFPPTFHLVLREAETYRATHNATSLDRGEVEPTANILAVRKGLRGCTMLIIGGDPRDHAVESLKKAFLLEEVVWLESQEHQSIERFKPYIVRPDVKLVVLLIRWASHSYGDLKPFCDRHGKAFVRLPAGYGPNQVASQILTQCGYLLTSGMEGR